jgi:hypothetical protein
MLAVMFDIHKQVQGSRPLHMSSRRPHLSAFVVRRFSLAELDFLLEQLQLEIETGHPVGNPAIIDVLKDFIFYELVVEEINGQLSISARYEA